MDAGSSDVPQLLQGFCEDAALAARLADVERNLSAWSEGDDQAGLLAADALDQLHGVLPDLARTAAELHKLIPALLAQLPAPPE